LKARIGWIDSIFKYAWERVFSVNARECCRGVGGRYARSFLAARSTSSGVTPCTSASSCFKTAKLPSLHARGCQQVNDDLDRIAPRESAHAKARDKKVRGPKVVAVNPGLKKLAQHLADKRRKKAKA